MKKLCNIVFTVSVVVMLLLNGTAHEFAHSFLGHSDTVHQSHHGHDHDDAATFESEHHHCDMLDLVPPVFLANSAFCVPAPLDITSGSVLTLYVPGFRSADFQYTFLRGPPEGNHRHLQADLYPREMTHG